MEYKQFMQRLVGRGWGLDGAPSKMGHGLPQKTKKTQLGLQFHEKKNMVATISQLMEITIMTHDPTAPRTFNSLKIGI